MPYRTQDGGFELASPLGHVPTVEHPLVKEALGRYEQAEPNFDIGVVESLLVDPLELRGDDRVIDWTISVDGSTHEHEIDPRFPSTRAIFLQIAGVIVDLHRLATRVGPYADPVAIAAAQQHAVEAGFLPSGNLIAKNGASASDAFRDEVYRFFLETRLDKDGPTMLESLLTVLASSPVPSLIEKCAVCHAEVNVSVTATTAICPNCEATIYPTDFLRTHEAFDPHGSNMTAAGRVMSAVEHLAHVAVLLYLKDSTPTSATVLASTAFVVDGPLAVFGETQKLKSPLLGFWQAACSELSAKSIEPPLLVGVEKTGRAAEYADAVREHVPPGFLMKLPAKYIASYIYVGSDNFGHDTYYGRKWLYRTRDGRILVITLPPLTPGIAPYAEGDRLELDDFPTLRPVCALLDRIGTQLFADALIPIALAHQWAAYPLQTADRVFRLMVDRELPRRASTNSV